MDKKEFWKIIEHARSVAGWDKDMQEETLVDTLAEYDAKDIVAFERVLRELIIEADNYGVMAADKIIEGIVSDDTYLYFRCWLIMQGQETFEQVLKDPDALADEIDDEAMEAYGDMFADFEALLYVSTTAYQIKTGMPEEDDTFPRTVADKAGLTYDFDAPPTKGKDWTEEELPVRYPKLWAMFN